MAQLINEVPTSIMNECRGKERVANEARKTAGLEGENGSGA